MAESLASSAGTDAAFADPFLWDHYWKESEKGKFQLGESPAIIPVATNAISGKRFVFSPFAFSFGSGRFENVLSDLNWTGPDEAGARAHDTRFFDAAVASASFPWVTC